MNLNTFLLVILFLFPSIIISTATPSQTPTKSPIITLTPTKLPTTLTPTRSPTPPTTQRPTTRTPTKLPTRAPGGTGGCPNDPTDSDLDGFTDCYDTCPTDFRKASPGMCGCGVQDTLVDINGDGTPDCPDGSAPELYGLSYGQFQSFSFAHYQYELSFVTILILQLAFGLILL